MRLTAILFSLCVAFSIAPLWAQPTTLDTLLQGKEYRMPPLDSTNRSKMSSLKVAGADLQGVAASKDATVYMLQFDAIADFDAAQARRADLQRRTGMGIQLSFDSPFYKLRAGGWTRKEDADDQVRILAESNIQALVVKVQK